MEKNGRHPIVLVMPRDFRGNSIENMAARLIDLSWAYEVEKWELDYFTVDNGELLNRSGAKCYLPMGYELAYDNHSICERRSGPVKKVQAWGVIFEESYLNWCPDYQMKKIAAARKPSEAERWDAQAATWDLPGTFVLASKEEPFTVKSPAGRVYVFEEGACYEEALKTITEQGWGSGK